MKKLFQKSGALTMAFLVLFSTMSFTVNQHYCGKILVDQSVFSETKACCKAMHHSIDDNATDKNRCCSNKEIKKEGQKNFKASFQNFDFQQQFVFTAFFYSYLNLFENLPEQVVPFKNYSPPLLVYDIQILDATFLIWFYNWLMAFPQEYFLRRAMPVFLF